MAGIAAGGYFVYDNYIKKQNNRSILSVVPKDAVFIMETDNLTKAWKEISNSNIWHDLLQSSYFNYVNEYANVMDKFFKNNKALDLLLKDRPMLISAQMISAADYDFLFVIDLQSTKTLSKGFESLLKIVKNYNVKKRDYKEHEVIEFIDKSDPNDIIYFCIKDNLLLATFTGKLIERTIDNIELNYWGENPDYKIIRDELSARKLFKFYFNYRQLPQFIDIYLDDMQEYSVPVSKALSFSAFDANLAQNKLLLSGYSALDSLPSYLSALSELKPGDIKSYKVISDQMALYFSVGFKDYNKFFNKIVEQYEKGNSQEMKEYRENVQMMEKLLGIDVQKNFFDWIGQEISLVKLRPYKNTKLKDVVVLIHAENIEDAKSGLGKIVEQVRKRSPLKFKTLNYKNHNINYLATKGIFKLLFSKFFNKIEKPYFTYIDDFVVFSNSKDAIMQMIDDYLTGHTLSHNKDFMDFKANFEVKSNVSLFVQMPKLYPNIYRFSNEKTKKSVKENQDLILSFNLVGLQLVSKLDMFKTKFVSDHNENANVLDQLEIVEKQASEELISSEYDSLEFKIVLPDTLKIRDTTYTFYHKDGKTVKSEGKIVNNLPEGLWRSYYASGHLKSSVNYKNGKINGAAFFYFDDGKETKQVEIGFKDDVKQGKYQEFYDNGAQKATLFYEQGNLHGDAEFYHTTGKIKIKGKYKNGKRRGKWLFFDTEGNIINKERN